jgi:nucleotide-binding universal stress UspA family protein
MKALVALDGSARSERSLPWIKAFRSLTDVTLLRVLDPVYGPYVHSGTLLSEMRQDIDEYLKRLAARFSPKAATISRLGPAAATILDVADEIGADLIVISTHGGSKIARRVFGGTTEQLLHGSNVPLLVVPSWADKPPAARIGKIVVPLDGSAVSESILPLAHGIGRESDAQTILVHVLTGPDPSKERIADLESHFAAIVRKLDQDCISARVAIVRGTMPQAVLRLADKAGADLIVMAAHGYGAATRMLLGSDAAKLIRESSLPVLVARYRTLRKMRSLPGQQASPARAS